MTPAPAPEPCVLVIFGASGDLTWRKLIPALYEQERRGELPERMAVLGVSRTAMTDVEFRDKLGESTRSLSEGFDGACWTAFSRRLHYHAADAAKAAAYGGIAARISTLAAERGLGRAGGAANVLFYLSVAPNLYEPIIDAIGQSGMVLEGKRWCSLDPSATPWQRIIIEKPFGTDLASARSLNRALGRVFEEEAIFRIDHYLGKELVQNILVLRFANSIFEPVWGRGQVDHVQVTAAETLGVGSRAATFYDGAGALRDMVQSHLLQVMAMVAMEPPPSFDADAIMREKIKLLGSARIRTQAEAVRFGALGRYGAGRGKGGEPQPAYADEPGVKPARRTETYAAIRVDFDNWRWAGVPFYLRSGKKLAAKVTEVVVQFKSPPTDVFRRAGEGDGVVREGNRLIIRVAPREGISLVVQGKVPGPGVKFASAALDLDYLKTFGGEAVEAYGPLLLDAMRGDRTLYKHRDEVESGWRICQPFLDSGELRARIEEYAPGSWGPRAADDLPGRDGRRWNNEGGGRAT